MIIPALHVPPPTAGLMTDWAWFGAGSGMNVQSEPQVSATGRWSSRPTLNCSMRAATRALN